MVEKSEKYWTAFYTKPRNEKKSAERLSAQGLEIYCPLRTTIRQWSDRKKKVKEPIFPSYIFAKIDERGRQLLLQDQGVLANVYWLGKPARIRETEIDAIKAFLGEFPDAWLSHIQVEEGQDVQIASGPLEGKSGVVRKIQGNKVFLQLETLGAELQAEININRLDVRS